MDPRFCEARAFVNAWALSRLSLIGGGRTADCETIFGFSSYLSESYEARPVVHTHPEILSGTPVFIGTCVPVRTLLDYLEGGNTLDQFLEDFPGVSRDQVVQFLKEAVEAFLARVA
jgi:uncharacterized protein (DUF433 family)